MLMFQPWFFHQRSGQLGRQVLSWGGVSDLRRLGREPVSSLSVSLHLVLVLLSLPSGFAFVGQSPELQNGACIWLPWHPETPVLSAGNDTKVKTLQHLCTPGRYITDFYAQLSQPQSNNTSLSFLSARCSDEKYIGYYALFSSRPLGDRLVSSDFGFSSMNGSAGNILESIGFVTDVGEEWTDNCPSATVVTGYEVTFVPGRPISRIRLLCSNVAGPACGAESPDSAAPVLAPTLVPAPASALVYVEFAIQWSHPGDVSVRDVYEALQSLSRPTPLQTVGLDCVSSIPEEREANTSVACFKAGPLPADDAVRLVQIFGNSNSSQVFKSALAALGKQVDSSKYLYAAVSNLPASGRNGTPPIADAPAPSEKEPAQSNDSNSTGLVIGCVVAGAVAVSLLAVVFVLLYQRRRRLRRLPVDTHVAEEALSSFGSAKNAKSLQSFKPSQGPLQSSPRRVDVTIMTSPFAAVTDLVSSETLHISSTEVEVTARDEPHPQGWLTQRGDLLLGAERGKKLPEMRQSSPLPANQSQGPWAASPPPLSVELPACFAPCNRLTQDSDELMEASKGTNTWRVVHDNVQEVSEEGSPDARLRSSEREDCSMPDTVERGGPSATSLTTSHWEIRPSDLQICRGPDGKYVELGSGAFGKVYKALLNEVTEVAVKRLEASSDNQRALFLREIDIHKRCRSGHVVQFLGACIQADCMFLVTELMDTSLDRIIHGEEPFTWDTQGKQIALDVAQALAYLHTQRVVHLDIKSRNVLLTREGEAKVADVGLSQVLQNTYLSRFDGMGTFAYAAPELLSGGSNCSTKADIWSYGILLHEMVTREHPKRGALSDRSPKTCPKHVDDLIQRCIERHPADRPSAKVIVKVLAAESPEQAETVLNTSLLEESNLEFRHRPTENRSPHVAMLRSASTPGPLMTDLRRWSCG